MLASPAQAAPRRCGLLQPRAELRCAKPQLRQARAHLHHHAFTDHSRWWWKWRRHKAQHWVREARYRIKHPPVAHRAFFLCVHAGEGAWNDPDSGHSGHFGGLQMTSPWGRGDYYVYRADWLTPYEQMRKAELGYKASGYSFAWVSGQWYHPECFYLA